jgi:hypothetical protein
MHACFFSLQMIILACLGGGQKTRYSWWINMTFLYQLGIHHMVKTYEDGVCPSVWVDEPLNFIASSII